MPRSYLIWALFAVSAGVALALLLFEVTACRADDVVSTSCSHSIYGTTCRTVFGGDTGGSTARIVHVPPRMEFNNDPNWGRGCRSCVDLSKPNEELMWPKK